MNVKYDMLLSILALIKSTIHIPKLTLKPNLESESNPIQIQIQNPKPNPNLNLDPCTS